MPNMTETPHQTKSPKPTPEQLLQLIDVQIQSQRAKRKGAPKHRATLLVGGLLLILGGLFAALLVLQQMASDLRHPADDSPEEILAAHSQ